MIKYDCIVKSNDIYGLTVALFLARKMRKVLVIQDNSKPIDYYDVVDFTDPENKKYHFEYNPFAITSGMDSNGLLYEYLDDLGLVDELDFTKILEDNIVELDGKIKRRIHTFSQLKVYLVRNYPKSRDRIHRFFDDLERHYENFVYQNINMLRNTEYTLSSLMIEWGDYSLAKLLKKYFNSEALREEFLINDMINGLNPEEVNSYSFFSNYFIGLKKGFYYLNNSDKELRNIIIKKIKLINSQAVIKTRIKEYIKDEDGKIKSIVDKDDKEYFAKYFFIEDNPVHFYQKNFEGLEEDIKVIEKYYPNFTSTSKINTIYLALNQNPKNLGVNDLIYIFKNQKESKEKIIKLFNYSIYTKADKRKNQGLICVDYVYDDLVGANKESILKRIYEVFPKLKKAVVGVREGKAKPYFPMLSSKEYRKNLSVNELIDIESIDHIQVFDNLYVGNKYYRPEAKLFGVINQAIVFADKIEDRLYFGDEDDDTYHYLNNEEIMTLIKHNYDYKKFEQKEIHVNFNIGKHVYFVRTKNKNIVVHYGKYSNADLAIYTTNDTLSNLLLKKVSFEEVLRTNSLKYRGNKELLFKAVDAFGLDDYQEYSSIEYKKSPYKNFGAKILFGYFFVYSLVCLLSNYFNAIYFYPPALILMGGITYIKIRTYEKVYWFDIFINFILLVGVVLSIFLKSFNTLMSDDLALGIMALALMISVFSNHPIVLHYTKFDQNIDYRNSTLFKTITNGLTFVWGFIFLTILVGTYITGQRYVSVLYNLYFVGIFLMYYYPIIYVNTNIKK